MQTPSLLNQPGVSIVRGADNKQWVRFTGNPRDIHRLTRENARGQNGRQWWNSQNWNSIPGQDWPTLDASGVADFPLQLIRQAKASLPDKPMRPGRAMPAVTGAVWDIPAVQAGLPLAARTRARVKLPPRDIRLGLSISGAVTAEKLARALAPLANAINAYTKAGGAVSLTVYDAAMFFYPPANGTVGAYIETRINASDEAAVAFALSPAFPRNVSYPLIAECSGRAGDALKVCRPAEFPVKGVTALSGYGDDIFREVSAIVETLKVA